MTAMSSHPATLARSDDVPALPTVEPVPLTRPSIGAAELAAVAEVFGSGWLAGQGPRSIQLEAGFAELTGRRHAIAVNNCTAGLHLALIALGVGPGDEVLVADYTFPATGHAVLYCGATPVLVDVLPGTGTMDPQDAAAAITEQTRGIIAVDALGMPADWGPLQRLARDRGLFLLEDAACGAGAEYQQRPCGSFGDIAVFSLHARKGITCGEGGVIVTDDDDHAEAIRRISCFGMTSAFRRQTDATLQIPSFAELGYNYKLSDVLAAIAVVQLGRLTELHDRRQQAADRYSRALAGIPGLTAPATPADRVSSWQTYAVTLERPEQRDRVAEGLRLAGIGSTIGTYALHRQPVYGSDARPCPVSGRLFDSQLALPMFPELTVAQQDRVLGALARLLAAAGHE